MKALALTLASALALSGCVQIDKFLNDYKPSACAAVDYSHAVFLASVESGEIKQRWVDDEAKVYLHMATLCAQPQINTITAITAAAIAYRDIKARAEKDK